MDDVTRRTVIRMGAVPVLAGAAAFAAREAGAWPADGPRETDGYSPGYCS